MVPERNERPAPPGDSQIPRGGSAAHFQGIAKYHEEETRPTFKGEPLTQAIEEALDLVFYLWVEQRRQEEEAK